MKTIYCLIFILLSQTCYAQYNGYNPSYNNSMNNIGLGLQGVLYGNYASSANQGNMYGEAALVNAYGNYVVNQSTANINNQTAYSMSLDNQKQRATTYFEKRQINRYYRDIEQWQSQERSRLKREGLYDKEAIEYIYGIKRPY